jgi:Glyoxalase-like domain
MSTEHRKSLLDHLVVAASTLADGVAWCERTLGITPGPGGEHPLMGTHNRLFSVASPQFPRAYFEIIAINQGAACQRIEGARRWFDLDNEALQLSLQHNGPRLIHFVASTAPIQPAIEALASLGLDRGESLAASRMTPDGLLSWQITVRQDGQRLMDGMLPTLIEWGDVHPSTAMTASGVALQSLSASLPDAAALLGAYTAIGLKGVTVNEGPANLVASLQTPRGLVLLASSGI